MPACQNNQLRAANKLARLVLISAIQHGILTKLQTQRFQVPSDPPAQNRPSARDYPGPSR